MNGNTHTVIPVEAGIQRGRVESTPIINTTRSTDTGSNTHVVMDSATALGYNTNRPTSADRTCG